MANLRSVGNGVHPVGSLAVANYALNPSFELPDLTQLANARTNLCTNPSLETGTTGWGSTSSFWTNTSTIVRSSAWSAAGSYSLQCTTPGSLTLEGCWFRATLAANTTYTVSATIKSVSGRPITLHLRDETNGVSGTASTAVTVGTTARVSATITTGATASPSLLIAFGGDSTIAASVFYVDALLIEQGSTVNPYFDGSTDLTISRTNLCTNPSFETGTTGWTTSGSTPPTFATSTAHKIFGTKSGLITWPATSTAPLVQYALTTTVGAIYSASLYVYVPSGSPTVTLAAGGLTQTSSVFNDWQRLSLVFTATATTTNVQITPTFSGTGTCYVEAVLMEQGSLGLYFDGSLPKFNSTGVTQSWSGTAHASTSNQFVPVGTIAWTGTANASTSNRWDLGVKDWTVTNATVTQVAVGLVPGGNYCAKMVPNTVSLIPSMAQTFTVVDSTNYSISMLVYLPATITGGGLELQLNSYDIANGAITVDLIPLLLSGSPTNGFVRLATTYMTPAGTATLTVAIRPTNQPSSTADVIYIDNFMFEQADTPSVTYVDGSFAGYCWSGTPNDSATLKTEFPDALNGFGTYIWQTQPTVTRTNLVPNPSFEVDLTGWTPSVGTMARTTTVAALGSASVQWTATGTQTYGGVYPDVVAATPGLAYTAQARVLSATTPRYVRLYLYFYDVSMNVVGSFVTPTASRPLTSTSVWTLASYSAVAPANTAWVRMFAYVTDVSATNIPAGEVHYFDALMLEQSSSYGDYFDGSFTSNSRTSYAWTGTPNQSPSTQIKTVSVSIPVGSVPMGAHATLHEAPWSPVPFTD